MALLWKKFEFFDPFWVLFCQNSNFSPKKRTDKHIFISVYSHSQNNLISLSDRRECFQSFAVLLFRSISDFAMTMARATAAVCERNVLTIDRSTFILYMLVVSFFSVQQQPEQSCPWEIFLTTLFLLLLFTVYARCCCWFQCCCSLFFMCSGFTFTICRCRQVCKTLFSDRFPLLQVSDGCFLNLIFYAPSRWSTAPSLTNFKVWNRLSDDGNRQRRAIKIKIFEISISIQIFFRCEKHREF